jgi:arabinogalactan oligomer / maltooligosaccharide transport system substrate-binding protein
LQSCLLVFKTFDPKSDKCFERHFMKIRNRGIVAAFAAAALLGTGIAPALADTKTINIWMDDQRGAQLSPVWDGSTTIAPGYTVKITTFASRDAMISAWGKATSASGPDMMFDAASSTTDAAKNGKALPIVLSKAQKSELPAAALGALSYQGVQYGIPVDVDTTTMYWNTKFGPAPKTFAALAATFQKYKKAGKVTNGVCAGDGTWGALPVLTALGGGAWGYKADGTPDVSKVLFNSPAFIKNASALLVDSKGKGNGLLAWDNCTQNFLDGKTLGMNSGSWKLNDVINAGIHYTLQPVPTLDGKGTSHQWSGFGGVFGTSYSKDHGVDLGVKAALSYFASQNGALAYSTATKRPPVNSKINAHLSPDVAGFAAAAKTGLVQENALLGDNAGGANWYDVLSSTFDAAFNKNQGVKASFDKGAAILKADFADGFSKR